MPATGTARIRPHDNTHDTSLNRTFRLPEFAPPRGNLCAHVLIDMIWGTGRAVPVFNADRGSLP